MTSPREPDAREALAWPTREVVAREIRRAMLDNPTEIESFNKRAQERERIADIYADIILDRFRLALPPAIPPSDDWKDDPSSDERWNAGLDFGMQQFCKALDVDPAKVTWDAATETVDGDVQAVIWNILRARFGDDWNPDATPSDDRAKVVEECARIADRAAIHDEEWASKYPDEAKWSECRAHRAKTIAISIRSLSPSTPPTESELRQAGRCSPAATVNLPPEVARIIGRLAWNYEVNDCQERDPNDALEIAIFDLKTCKQIAETLGLEIKP